MPHRRPSVALALLAAVLVAPGAGAKQTAEKCAAARDAATVQLAGARLGCLHAALLHDQAIAESCVAKAAAKFLAKMEKIEAKGSCRAGGDADTIVGFVDALTGRLEGALAAPPSEGALRLSWVILNSGTPVTCDAVNGAAGVEVDLTPMGGGNAIARQLPCDPGQGDVLAIPPGTYLMSASIVDAQQQAIATAPTQEVTFDATCDVIVSGDCGKLVSVEFAIL